MSQREYSVDYRLSDDRENVHHVWDNSLEPAHTVDPGDVVRFECRDATDQQVTVETTAEDVPEISFDRSYFR